MRPPSVRGTSALLVGPLLLAVLGSACGSSNSNASPSDGGPSKDGSSSGGSSGGGGDSGALGDDAMSGDDGSPPGEGGAPTVGGVPGGAAGAGTTVSGCEIFPADNPWNVRIDGAGVQVIHTYDAALPQGTSLHPDFGGYTMDTGGIPYNVVPASQADVQTVFSVSASESDPGPNGWMGGMTPTGATGTTDYPFFLGMHIEGNPAPGGTPGSLPGDQHAIVLQQGGSAGDPCTSYEAWNCVVSSTLPFQCANGAVFDLTSNMLRPAGWTSADAAGLSILAGLVKLSEVQAGAVTHAIRVTFNNTQNGYIPPATHAASSKPLGSPYPPMGLRLRLMANVPTSSYTQASQTIMAAMKEYGLIVADNGSDWFFQGDSDDGWTVAAPDGQDTLINEIVGDFRMLRGSDFEAVYSGAPVGTGL
jgi:hypothetical protein